MVDGAEALASKPLPEALPESRDDGLETEEGPSETEPRTEDFRDPAEDLDRERGGRIAGGGNGGGSTGKNGCLSPPGT